MKEKLQKVFIILSLASLPFVLYFGASIKSHSTIQGKVVDFGAVVDDFGIHSFLIVKLEDNRTVKIDYQLASGFDIGKKVLVKERVTKLFNMKMYRIVKWYK